MGEYFVELKEQIMNKENWDKNRFHVFNHEAGTGKSQNTFKFLAEMSQREQYRVLYVQRFVRDDELLKTVSTINEHAEREVAMGFDGKDTRYRKRKLKAFESQILCISHKMYEKICQGTNQHLIENRDILIIDEYPDLLERISVTINDVGRLWVLNYKERHEVIETLANIFRNKLTEVSNYEDTNNVLYYINFRNEEYEKLNSDVAQLMNLMTNEERELLFKFQQVIENGCFFYENGFHTFNNKNQFRLLSNNIILDANAGFDYRYNLSKKFFLRKQDLYYNYSNSTFHHYEVKTGKNSLSKKINFHDKVLEKLSPEQKESILLITDKDNKEIFEEKVHNRFISLGMDEKKIKEILEDRIRIDYFGNIIGVNDYRDFNSIAILKTPNYDYLTYALTYFYYSKIEGNSVSSIELFKNEKVENIRISSVAGEMYQAIKRINRNNSQHADIFVFADFQEAVDLTLKQFPSIKYKRYSLAVRDRKVPYAKVDSKFEKKVNKVKNILFELRESGRDSIRKKELRERIGESDKSNFAKVLKKLTPFFEENNFHNKGQRIYM